MKSALKIRLGNLQINKIANGQEYKVSEIRSHPKYNRTTYNYDVAVLMVKGSMDAANIMPIELNEAPIAKLVGKIATVSGFGKVAVITQYKQMKNEWVYSFSVFRRMDCILKLFNWFVFL